MAWVEGIWCMKICCCAHFHYESQVFDYENFRVNLVNFALGRYKNLDFERKLWYNISVKRKEKLIYKGAILYGH